MRILSTVVLLSLISMPSFASISHPLEQVAPPKQLAAPTPAPLVVLQEDYDPNREKRVEADTDALAEIINTANLDYEPGAKEITVNAPIPRPPEGYLKKIQRTIGYGLYKVGEHTVRISLGCTSNYMFNEAAALAFSRATYAITLYFTGNPWIANFMYATVSKTCQPLVAAIVFYAGAHVPDLIYYSGKTTIKTVQITGDIGILLVQAAKQGAKGIARLLGKEIIRNQMIEMSILHRPNEISLIGQ